MLKMRKNSGGPYIIEDLDTGKTIPFKTHAEAWAYLKIKAFVARVDGTLPVSKTQTVDSLIPPEAYGTKRVTYKVVEVAV